MTQRVNVVKYDTTGKIVPLNIGANGNLSVQTNGVRNTTGATANHRTSVTAPDLVGAVATAPVLPTLADDGAGVSGASLAATTAYYVGYVVRNGMGVTMASAIATLTTSASAGHAINVLIPTTGSSQWRITGSDVYYEFFLSVDAAAPKHVCTISATNLAAGSFKCNTAETVVAGTSAVWSIDIGVVGANAQTTAAQFVTSTALLPANATPVSTSGYNNVDLFVDASQTAYTTTAPSLTLIPVYLNDKQATNYHVGAPIYVNLLGGQGQSFRQVYNLTTNGASVIILVASIANVTVNRIDITPTSVV
jgi:hypothetical protein